MTEPKRRGRPRKNPLPINEPTNETKAENIGKPLVNWELLSKRLQEALQSSIEDNKIFFDDNCKLVVENRNLTTIVKYLESRLDRANDSI